MKYPRGKVYTGLHDHKEPIRLGKSEWICKGQHVVILAVGNIIEECDEAVTALKGEGIQAGLVNVRFLKPFDEDLIRELAEEYSLIVTVEENQLTGGFGQTLSAFLHKMKADVRLLSLGIPDCYVKHATVGQQRKEYGIDSRSICRTILQESGQIQEEASHE